MTEENLESSVIAAGIDEYSGTMQTSPTAGPESQMQSQDGERLQIFWYNTKLSKIRFLQAHKIQSWNPVSKTRVHSLSRVSLRHKKLYIHSSNVSYLNVPKPSKLLVTRSPSCVQQETQSHLQMSFRILGFHVFL